MNDNYLCSDFSNYVDENPLPQMEKAKPRSTKVSKILKILLCTLVIVVAVEGFAYFILIPSTSEYTVMFSGNESLGTEDLTRTLALYCGTNWLRFDTAVAAAHLSTNSSVESISVEKRFPDRILVDIKERIPVAITLATVDSKTISVLIDKNGVLFGLDTQNSVSSLPLITGLEFGSVIDGMRLNSKFYPLIKEISDIQKTNPAYFSVISEIQIIPKEYDNYELAIYPIHLKTRVLVDRNLNKESLAYMMVALDIVKDVNSGTPSQVDLRYGTVSYKMN